MATKEGLFSMTIPPDGIVYNPCGYFDNTCFFPKTQYYPINSNSSRVSIEKTVMLLY